MVSVILGMGVDSVGVCGEGVEGLEQAVWFFSLEWVEVCGVVLRACGFYCVNWRGLWIFLVPWWLELRA